MSKHARDHAHCGDQSFQKLGIPNQSGRGPIHTPPDQTGFTRTNSTVFNPKILEASIKEIASCLEDGAKADLLLYAAKKLDTSRESSRSLVENAVQSCLLIPNLATKDAVEARLLRAKTRLVAGYALGAHRDIEAALMLDPEDAQAKALMSSLVPRARVPNSSPGFSNEIWTLVASFLGKDDLKMLLSIPHVLSRIASQKLFQKLDLHFAADKSESQKSADMLTRIILDPAFAIHVKTIRIFVPAAREPAQSFAFQLGMISNALPKLSNLRRVHITMRWKDLQQILKMLHVNCPRLSGLSIESTDGTGELVFPKFAHLKDFAFTTKGGDTPCLDEFLKHIRAGVRTLAIKHRTWNYPSPLISVRHLAHLDIGGIFDGDSFDQILSNGHQLETLRLSCELHCVASTAFRTHAESLPFLRHFAIWITEVARGVKDADLFPALTEFIRSRQPLRLLTVGCGNQYFDTLGFNASTWGVFPSLQNLLGLITSLPSDMAPPMIPLFSWMLPRNLQYLNLANAFASCGVREFLTQFRPGVPPSLKVVGLYAYPPEESFNTIIELGFPMVDLLWMNCNYHTVVRKPGNGPNASGSVELEEWSSKSSRYNRTEKLTNMGVVNSVWKDPFIGDFW